MKSFKLISLQIMTGTPQLVDVELVDGLIINKENSSNMWIVEALVEENHYNELKKIFQMKRKMFTFRLLLQRKKMIPLYLKPF